MYYHNKISGALARTDKQAPHIAPTMPGPYNNTSICPTCLKWTDSRSNTWRTSFALLAHASQNEANWNNRHNWQQSTNAPNLQKNTIDLWPQLSTKYTTGTFPQIEPPTSVAIHFPSRQRTKEKSVSRHAVLRVAVPLRPQCFKSLPHVPVAVSRSSL